MSLQTLGKFLEVIQLESLASTQLQPNPFKPELHHGESMIQVCLREVYNLDSAQVQIEISLPHVDTTTSCDHFFPLCCFSTFQGKFQKFFFNLFIYFILLFDYIYFIMTTKKPKISQQKNHSTKTQKHRLAKNL
jgi:hypothetical protein